MQVEVFLKMETDGANICLLCDKLVNPEQARLLKEKAIATLIDASLKRKDNKHKKLQKCQALTIYTNCHSNYVKQSSIKTAQKQASISKVTARKNSIALRQFDFSKYCIFCGEEASDEYNAKREKYPNANLSKVKIVSSDT